jgi:hypothetical protein
MCVSGGGKAQRRFCRRSVSRRTSTRMQAQYPFGNTSQCCLSSLREGVRNERPRQSQALDITKRLECASLVSGLQHFHNLGSPATFPPTECQMAAASYLCVRPWNGIGAARDPGPLLDSSCGDRGLVRSPVPSLNSLSMGPGIVDCHWLPARGQGGIKWPRMGESLRKHHLGAEQRRALQFLASSPFGVSEAIMFAQGFKRRMLASLIRAGLATAQRENIKAGSLAVGRIRITEAGRRALEG